MNEAGLGFLCLWRTLKASFVHLIFVGDFSTLYSELSLSILAKDLLSRNEYDFRPSLGRNIVCSFIYVFIIKFCQYWSHLPEYIPIIIINPIISLWLHRYHYLWLHKYHYLSQVSLMVPVLGNGTYVITANGTCVR